MSFTETRMAFPQPAIVIKLQDDFAKLTPIIRKYKGWHDDLSHQIKDWWLDVRRTGADMRSLSAPAANASIREKANKLQNFILVDCLRRTPLATPVLVHGWTWERTSLDKFKKYFTLFDERPLTPEAPHEFAKEVLAWTKSVAETVSDVFEERSTALIPRDAIKEDEALQIFILNELAKRAITLRQERQGTFRMNQMDQAVEMLVAKLREQRLVNIQEQRDINAQHEKDIRRNIEDLKNQQAETVQVLEERIDSTEKRNQETRNIDQKTINTLSEDVHELRKALDEALKKLALEEKKNAELTALANYLSMRLANAESRQAQLEDELNNQGSCVIS